MQCGWQAGQGDVTHTTLYVSSFKGILKKNQRPFLTLSFSWIKKSLHSQSRYSQTHPWGPLKFKNKGFHIPQICFQQNIQRMLSLLFIFVSKKMARRFMTRKRDFVGDPEDYFLKAGWILSAWSSLSAWLIADWIWRSYSHQHYADGNVCPLDLNMHSAGGRGREEQEF